MEWLIIFLDISITHKFNGIVWYNFAIKFLGKRLGDLQFSLESLRSDDRYAKFYTNIKFRLRNQLKKLALYSISLNTTNLNSSSTCQPINETPSRHNSISAHASRAQKRQRKVGAKNDKVFTRQNE